MNPIIKLLYYESFIADLEEKHEFARSYAIFNGSFTNMEMAQRMISDDQSKKSHYQSTDTDFDQSTNIVFDERKKTLKRKRKRRTVIGNTNE